MNQYIRDTGVLGFHVTFAEDVESKEYERFVGIGHTNIGLSRSVFRRNINKPQTILSTEFGGYIVWFTICAIS